MSHSTPWKGRAIRGGLIGALSLGVTMSLAVLIGADRYPELHWETLDPYFVKHAILVLFIFGTYSGAIIGGLTTDPRSEDPDFRSDLPNVRIRVLPQLIEYGATTLDEFASAREILLSWVMAAWIAVACLYMIRAVGWWKDVLLPLLFGVSFTIAPLIGSWSVTRWLRRGKKQMILNGMAWMLLVLFVATFCGAWIVLWDANPSRWVGYEGEQ